MKRAVEEKLKLSLVDVLENWWDSGAQEAMATDVTPYVGDDLFNQMAYAALAVFLACADVQESAIRDGVLIEKD